MAANTRPIYGLWSENLLLALPTITVPSGGATPSDVQTITTNGNPAYGLQTSVTSLRITFDWGGGTPKLVKLFMLINHNVDVPAAGAWQANTTNAFGSPPVNIGLTIGAREADGYRADQYVDVDPTNVDVARQFSSLVINSNPANVIIGQLFLGSARHQFPRGFQFAAGPIASGPSVDVIEHKTWGGVSLRVNKGFRIEYLQGSFRGTEAECDQVLDLFRQLGGLAQPIFIVPDPTRAFCMMALLDLSTLRKTFFAGGASTSDRKAMVSVIFRQLSRGMGYTW